MGLVLHSQDELRELGWTERQIEATLDEPNSVEPLGYRRINSGRSPYGIDRVVVAAYRMVLQKVRSTDAHWQRWAGVASPTARPLPSKDFT